jgi:pullulanase
VNLPEGNWQALLLDEAVDPEGTQTISGTVEIGERTVLLVRAE